MTRVVDYNEAVDMAGGNPELAKDLFGMLLKDLPILQQQLLEAISQADMTAIRDHAHKIHGSTAYCSVPQLREAAATMETITSSQDLAAIRKQFQKLETAIKALLDLGPGYLEQSW
ncbi:MAG: Hpt domain-containing protein [Gammaproteobacteria bacterium]|jgi:two-component system, NarL family, sensor histidine kinase BarA